jgi:hypothetical protein
VGRGRKRTGDGGVPGGGENGSGSSMDKKSRGEKGMGGRGTSGGGSPALYRAGRTTGPWPAGIHHGGEVSAGYSAKEEETGSLTSWPG